VGFWGRRYDALARSIDLNVDHAQTRYFQALSSALRPHDRWLELGCGGQLVPDWAVPLPTQSELVSRARLLAGIDIDSALTHNPLVRHKVFGLGDNLPFADNSFDIVSANMVVEHLEFPVKVFSEVHRVLAPGGRFLFHTTNYHNPVLFTASLIPDGIKKKLIVRFFEDTREEEDIFPTFYRVNTPKAIRAVAEASSFAVSNLRVVGSVGFFNQLGPLGYLELFFLKLLTFPPFEGLNTNILGLLKKT